MATVKARGIKRPSATSYSSATTIVVFVGLSVLGLWLLTSNSFTPPPSTHITSIGRHHPHTHHPNPDPVHVERSNGHKADEAAVVEEPKRTDGDTARDRQDTKRSDIRASRDEEQGTKGSDIRASRDEEQGTKGSDIQASRDEEQGTKGSDIKDSRDEAQDTEGSDIQDQRDEPEKQAELETQTTEESSRTQKQVVEQVREENQQSETNVVTNETDHGSETGENEITDEDQQRRIDEHQKRGDEQNQQEKEAQSKDPNGATSHDQIQHDEEVPGHSHQDATIKETKHETLAENEDSTSIPQESTESKKSWTTQAHQSEDQKERRKTGSNDKENINQGHTWLLCNVTAGPDYIPCLDNDKVIARIHKRSHHEHRERHCPEDPPVCLVPLPHGYKKRIDWPQSRDKIWYNNVPHTSLAEYKGHQNWVKVTGEFLTFPGGGTQFIHGATHYIEFLQEAVPEIAWGKHSRVVLDVGCGVASFGGYLFEKDVITLSFAPKDEHEAQVQFALERGIPAISAVMGSQRLPFPSRVFDVVHCARCRVPWHADGGALLLELNRVLRPGGYFVWSATPVYQKLEEDVEIWREMSRLTVAMCWELVTIKKDKMNSIGAAIYQKPETNECYEHRKKNEPPLCKTNDDPNAAWYILLQSCMHRIPTQENERGSQWPEEWPERLQAPPYWLNKSQMGIYGKPAPDDFASDSEHWNKLVSTVYMNDMGINWSEVRNVMDLRAVYGGFAAALKDQNLWVLNVVNVDSPDTLPIIYERGLLGIYHDWCESFSTYPRSYDLLHADHLFSKLKRRCSLEAAIAEIDRILRPGGKLIMRDEAGIVAEVLDLLKSLHWEVLRNHSKNKEGILSAQKSYWRPTTFADAS